MLTQLPPTQSEPLKTPVMCRHDHLQVSFASGPAELANTDERGALVLSGGRYGDPVEAGDVLAPAKRTVALVGLVAPPPGLEQHPAARGCSISHSHLYAQNSIRTAFLGKIFFKK